MKIIFKTRQSGRTQELVKLCAEAEARGEVSYIVCSSQQAAYTIQHQAKELGLFIGFPITFDEFLNRQYEQGGHIKNFYIDNADSLLRWLTTVPIRAITLENMPEEKYEY